EEAVAVEDRRADGARARTALPHRGPAHVGPVGEVERHDAGMLDDGTLARKPVTIENPAARIGTTIIARTTSRMSQNPIVSASLKACPRTRSTTTNRTALCV